jgi:hypothetical protein
MKRLLKVAIVNSITGKTEINHRLRNLRELLLKYNWIKFVSIKSIRKKFFNSKTVVGHWRIEILEKN